MVTTVHFLYTPDLLFLGDCQWIEVWPADHLMATSFTGGKCVALEPPSPFLGIPKVLHLPWYDQSLVGRLIYSIINEPQILLSEAA